jgi:hypothetical protein
MQEIESDNYYLVAKGGLGGKADTWIKIEGKITISVDNGMPLHVKADNPLSFVGFGGSIELTGNPCEYIDCEEPPVEVPTETPMFPNDNSYQNPRYIVEPTDWQDVSSEKQVIEGMDGYDFSPIVANQKGLYDYGAWSQGYISIGQKDVWSEGDVKYFLKPKGYKTDLSYNLMDFDLKFPDFKLPKDKFIVIQPTPVREIGEYNYLKKGVSFVKGKQDSHGYSFVSDAWLTDLGCPYAYDDRPNAREIFDKWCNDVDTDELLRSFIDKVYYPNRHKGYVMLNWEHVGNRWNVRKDKVIRCLEYWQNNEHTAKMALWTVSGISMGRPIFQGYGQDFSELLTFNGSAEEFSSKYRQYVTVDFNYAKHVEVGQIGGYMNYPIEEGVIHHYLTELLLHKKYNPSKTILATIWFDQEPISTFDIERVRVDSEDGTYFAQVKPKVFPSTAFNWGAWCLVGDGLDMWSDPNYWTEDKRYWGWGAIDSNGRDLPNRHDENLGKYPSQPMKNIDWCMAGVWAMSENKDILNSPTKWNFVTLPTKSFHEKTPLIAYKVKDDEALVLALDGFGKIDGETTHSFNIGNKSYEIKTFGRFTSVVRLKL